MKVVLLGAGFSRAISREMPLMKQLGPLVLERLCLPADTLAPLAGTSRHASAILAATNRG